MSLTKIPPELRQVVQDASRDKNHDMRCQNCARKVFPKSHEIDHIVPEILSSPEMRLDPNNLQVLCIPCHRGKSRAEAKQYKRASRAPKDWSLALVSGATGVAALGWGATLATNGWPFSPARWLEWCLVGSSMAFCTFLVQNAFAPRAPLEKKTVKPEKPEVAQGLDVERIQTAVREIVGPKGTVTIQVESKDKFAIIYAGTGFEDRLDSARYDLLNQIQTKIGDRWKALWDTEHDSVTMTRRPPMPKLVPHPGFQDPVWHKIPIAPDVVIDLKMLPHWLIVGRTLSGKTTTLHTIIQHSMAASAQVRLADPKRVELTQYRGQVHTLATVDDDLWQFPLDLLEEMEERFRLFEEEDVPLDSHPPIVAVIDEYKEYVRRMNGKWLRERKKAAPNPTTEAVASLLSLARKCNIHLFIGTQRPDSKWFGGDARDNCGGRITFGPVSAETARMMFIDGSIGRDLPASAKGRMTVQLEDGEPFESQAYYLAG